MTDDDKRAFWTLLQGVHEFYRVDLSTFAGRVWWQACRGYSLDQVTTAFDRHLTDPKSGQFMPKPADIVRQLQGTHEDRSAIAWGKVLDAIQRVGPWQSVAFDDGVIHAVIEDLGGWVKVCGTEYDELPFVQRRFCDTYRAHSQNRAPLGFPARLAGIADAKNGAIGDYSRDRTVLVGDANRALAVLNTGTAAGRAQLSDVRAAIAAAFRDTIPNPQPEATL
ncbi:MAG: DUF6475 domain-containing protein [Pseudomonadota bacterium]|jgi:hypothetical protein